MRISFPTPTIIGTMVDRKYIPFHDQMRKFTTSSLSSPQVELTHLVVKWSAVRNQSEISQKSVRNRNFFENAGHVFSFCQSGSAETDTKPCKTSSQGTSIKRPAIYWDHVVSWGGGVWASVCDIGRVGKK